MKMQWVLLVVTEHFKNNGLTLDVLNERLSDLNRNLLQQWKNKGFLNRLRLNC